jgi:hypothetical protein
MNKSVTVSINSDFSAPARVPLASGTFVHWRAPFKGLALYIFQTTARKIARKRITAYNFFASCATSVYLLQVMGSMYAG